MHKFDIICISESYITSDTLSIDGNLNIPGYNTSRADHPKSTWGNCIYYKVSLLIKMLNIKYLQECICYDLKIGTNFVLLCNFRSPSQSAHEFENFVNKLNLTMESVTQKNRFLLLLVILMPDHQNGGQM